jgi:hypothetical protein
MRIVHICSLCASVRHIIRKADRQQWRSARVPIIASLSTLSQLQYRQLICGLTSLWILSSVSTVNGPLRIYSPHLSYLSLPVLVVCSLICSSVPLYWCSKRCRGRPHSKGLLIFTYTVTHISTADFFFSSTPRSRNEVIAVGEMILRVQYPSLKVLNGYDIHIVALSFRRLFVLQTATFAILAETYIQRKERKQIRIMYYNLNIIFINQQLLMWSWCALLCLCSTYLTETNINLMSLHDY